MDKQKREQELKGRVNEKIEEIEKYLSELSGLDIPKLEEYQTDFKIKAICERYFEKIIEEVISIAFLVIREKKLTNPENEEHAFTILSSNNIISKDLADKLREAKDMRNRIVHNYITIDDSMVYDAITEELLRDIEEFLSSISNVL